jgi:hypothetical protein
MLNTLPKLATRESLSQAHLAATPKCRRHRGNKRIDASLGQPGAAVRIRAGFFELPLSKHSITSRRVQIQELKRSDCLDHLVFCPFSNCVSDRSQ